MKTFTLRLNDEEAEALERIAFINADMYSNINSKNDLIKNMIINEYAAYDEAAVINGKIRILTPPEVFANTLIKKAEGFTNVDYCLAALAAIEYAEKKLLFNSETESQDTLADLQDKRKEIIDKLERIEPQMFETI